jgi:hypothetical protein
MFVGVRAITFPLLADFNPKATSRATSDVYGLFEVLDSLKAPAAPAEVTA